MKTTTMKNSNKQGGFTIFEIGLALVVAIVLGFGVYAGFTATFDSAKERQVGTELSSFTLAVHRCLARNSSDLSGCDETSIVALSSLDKGKIAACGDKWSIAATKATVVLTYPIGGCSDSDGLGNGLVVKLDLLPNIGAVYTSTDIVVTGNL